MEMVWLGPNESLASYALGTVFALPIPSRRLFPDDEYDADDDTLLLPAHLFTSQTRNLSNLSPTTTNTKFALGFWRKPFLFY